LNIPHSEVVVVCREDDEALGRARATDDAHEIRARALALTARREAEGTLETLTDGRHAGLLQPAGDVGPRFFASWAAGEPAFHLVARQHLDVAKSLCRVNADRGGRGRLACPEQAESDGRCDQVLRHQVILSV
jgi:hypothetical protein